MSKPYETDRKVPVSPHQCGWWSSSIWVIYPSKTIVIWRFIVEELYNGSKAISVVFGLQKKKWDLSPLIPQKPTKILGYKPSSAQELKSLYVSILLVSKVLLDSNSALFAFKFSSVCIACLELDFWVWVLIVEHDYPRHIIYRFNV